MNKRLLSLLVFIPMFLIALYLRNHGGTPAARSGNSSARDLPTSENNRRDRDYPRDDDRANGRDSGRNEGPGGSGRSRYGRDTRGANISNQPGIFDFYLLNLSWSPEFCATHPGKPECDAHPGFVLHGLWPQNNDGSYPEHCSDAPGPSDPSAFRDIFPDAGLLSHEWSTHGTCSGLAPDAYFAQARSALHAVRIPNALAHLTQTTASTPDSILAQFTQTNASLPRESLALSCGNNHLTAVEVCLDHTLHAISCSNIRSCRANSVRIIPPGGTGN